MHAAVQVLDCGYERLLGLIETYLNSLIVFEFKGPLGYS